MTTTVTFDQLYHSRWLKAEDLPDEDLVLTIKDVTDEEVGPEEELKLILTFLEKDKQLILNKTNAKTLADRFGKDPNGWIGKLIALFATEVDFGGKATLAIRIRLKTPIKPVPQPDPSGNY
jgi:hypothetical protein